MSKLNYKRIFIFVFLAVVSAVVFGCKNKTPVSSIYFETGDQTQIILAVGDEIDLDSKEEGNLTVEISPSYASNKNYYLTTSNEQIVKISGHKITALKEGNAVVCAVSEDDDTKQSAINIKVTQLKQKLGASVLSYDEMGQSFNFTANENAMSYTVQFVNKDAIGPDNVTLELFGKTTISFKELGEDWFNHIVSVRVRANAPKYSSAFISSAWSDDVSGEFRVYQAMTVKNVLLGNGILSFEGSFGNYQITINDKEYLTTDKATVDMTEIDKSFLGNAELKIVEVLSDEKIKELQQFDTAKTKLKYYNAMPAKLEILVVDPVGKTEVADKKLLWQGSNLVQSYKVFVDGVENKVGKTEFDLSDIEAGKIFSAKVSAVMPKRADKVVDNLIFAKSDELIKFKKMSLPEIELKSGGLIWKSKPGDNATLFDIKFFNTTTNLLEKDYSTKENQLLLDDCLAGNSYLIKVCALTSDDSIWILPSQYAEFSFEKQTNTTNLKIEDYQLKFDAKSGDKYKIITDFGTSFEKSVIVSALSDMIMSDLPKQLYSAGKHRFSVVHLGDESSVDSDIVGIDFVQLEQVEEIRIENDRAIVDITETNKDANFVFVIDGNEVSINVGKEQNKLIYSFNSTNGEEQEFLSAGNHTISVRVEGNGKEILAFRTINGKVGATCAEKSFVVLDLPTIEFDKSTGVVLATGVEAKANFKADNSSKISELTDNSCKVVLNEGEKLNISIQNACSGEFVSSNWLDIDVQKLATPILNFEKSTNKFFTSLVENAESFVFSDSDYVMGSSYTNFVEGNNEFSLSNTAKERVGNHFFMNSETAFYTVFKIFKATGIELLESGNLSIITTHEKEFLPVLTISYAGKVRTFRVVDQVLTDGVFSLGYSFNNGKYLIKLVNESYDKIVSDLTSDFDVSIKFDSLDDWEISSDEFGVSGFEILSAPEFSVEEENLKFSSVGGLTIDNYYLSIDNLRGNKYEIPFASIVGENLTLANQMLLLGSFKYDYKTIYNYLISNYGCQDIADTTEMAVVVKSGNKIPKTSNKLLLKIQDSVILTTLKDNTKQDSSTFLKFENIVTSYAKTYVLEVFDLQGNKILDINSSLLKYEDENVLININELEIDESSFFVKAFVKPNSTENLLEIDGETKTVYVFSSFGSNSANFERVGEIENVRVEGKTVRFDPVQNAEKYLVSYNGKSFFALEPKFDFEQTELTNYSVKVIAFDNLDDPRLVDSRAKTLLVSNLPSPIVKTKEGNLEIVVPNSILDLVSTGNMTTLCLFVKNVSKGVGEEKSLTIDILSLEEGSNKITIDPANILYYDGQERLEFSYLISTVLSDPSEVKVNSQTVEILTIGLKQPTKLEKTTDSFNNIVQMITWADEINKIEGLAVGYRVEIIYIKEGVEYRYLSDVLGDLTLTFPSQTTDQEGNPVLFEDGFYKVKVKAIPISEATDYLGSLYSKEYSFQILSAPQLKIESGCVVWNNVQNATVYDIKIVKDDKTVVDSVLASSSLDKLVYDFSSLKLESTSGLIAVSVRAKNSSEFVLNSKYSTEITILRTQKATEASVVNGYFTFKSNPYYSWAEIIFTDINNSANKKTIIFDNQTALDELISNLEQSGKTSWQDSGIDFAQEKTFVVKNSSGLDLNTGVVYDIEIILHGNNWEDDAFAIVNSESTTRGLSNLKVEKLKDADYTVKYGEFGFKPNEKYLGSSNYSTLEIDYLFNAENASDFWKKVMIYRLSVAGVAENVFAVDYNSFVEYRSLLDESLIQEITSDDCDLKYVVKYPYSTDKFVMFNVFNNNAINLTNKRYFKFYPTSEQLVNGQIEYSSQDLVSIDVNQVQEFSIRCYSLGGQVKTTGEQNFAYLNASSPKVRTICRYTENDLYSFKGKLALNDQSKSGEEGIVDQPVYRLFIYQNSILIRDDIYLYYASVEDAKTVVSRHNSDSENMIYIQLTPQIVGDSICYTCDLSDYVQNNLTQRYQIRVKTYAGVGGGDVSEQDSVNYYIDSREPEKSFEFRVWSAMTISKSSGSFSWDLAKIENSSSGASDYIYAYTYEMTLSSVGESGEMESVVFVIDSSSTGVTIKNNKFYYLLPKQITTNLGETFEIKENTTYYLSVRALSIDPNENSDQGSIEEIKNLVFNGVLNGSYYKVEQTVQTCEFVRAPGVKEVKIKNGYLLWKLVDPTKAYYTAVTFSYVDEFGKTQILEQINCQNTITIDGETFYYCDLGDQKYNNTTSSGKEYIDQNQTYTVLLKVVPNEMYLNLISSNDFEMLFVNRLSTVDLDSVKSVDGILCWNRVENATGYRVVLTDKTNSNTYIYIVENETSLDTLLTPDKDGHYLPVGEYSITIRALGNEGFLTGMVLGNKQEFFRLESPTGIKLSANTASWNPVEHAQGYKVVFEYSTQEDEWITLDPITTTSTSILAPNELNGTIKITVQAVGIGEGKVFNGESSYAISSNKKPASTSEISFGLTDINGDGVQDCYAYTFSASDFLSFDTIEVNYMLFKYLSITDLDQTPTKVNTKIYYVDGKIKTKSILTYNSTITEQDEQDAEMLTIDGTTVFVIRPTIMGNYTNFSTKITRPGTLDSDIVVAKDQTFQIYSFGDGKNVEYHINNLEQFLNIKYYIGAKYVMDAYIDISPAITSGTSFLIEQFEGELDGQNKLFYSSNYDGDFANEQIEDTNEFALFKNINNAKIKNLSIKSENRQIVLKMFAKSNSNVVQLGVMAINATNSTFENIRVENVKLIVVAKNYTQNEKLDGQILASGFVVNMADCEIKNSYFDVNVEIDSQFTNQNNILAGIVAVATSNSGVTKLTNNDLDFAVSATDAVASNQERIKFVGGMVGSFTGNLNTAEDGIFNQSTNKVILNVSGLGVNTLGGVVASATGITVDGITATTSYTAPQKIRSATYGGAIGLMEGCELTNTTSNATFTITLDSGMDKNYLLLGSLVGRADSYLTERGRIFNCGALNQTSFSGLNFTLGAFGFKSTEVQTY